MTYGVNFDELFGKVKLGSPEPVPAEEPPPAPAPRPAAPSGGDPLDGIHRPGERLPPKAPVDPNSPEAQAHAQQVADAEAELRAWSSLPRSQRKAAAKSAAAAAAAPAAVAATGKEGDYGVDFDEIFGPAKAPTPPKPPKKSGLAKVGEFLSAGRSKINDTLAGITPEQAKGMLPEDPAAAPAAPAAVQGEQQSLARKPWEAETGTLAERRRARFAENDPRRVDRPFTPGPGGSILDRPEALDPAALQDMQGRNARDQAVGSVSPERAAREQAQAVQDQRDKRPYAEAKPLELTNQITSGIRDNVKNPALRGVIAGGAELGKVGTGAVRLAADLMGAEGVAKFAKGAEGRADATSKGSTQDLKGNEKLVADVFSSVVNSTPSLALATVGGGALRTLFAQTALQEYGAGRDAGFSVGESMARAGIMGFGEALGERFGLTEQVKLLKGVVKGMPSNEVAQLFGNMLVKEIPGEQLTTAVQFLADKFGPAALQPNATIFDYLEAAGETLKVTVGQTLLMGGGPAAISTTRNAMGQADQVRGMSTPEVVGMLKQRDLETFIAPQGDMPPTESRAAAFKRFDEMAAAFGFNPRAVARAKEAANEMPAADVPGFLAKLADVFEQRGATAKPIDEQSMRSLRQTMTAAEQDAKGNGAPSTEAPQSGATDGQELQAQDQPQEEVAPAPADVTTAGAQDFTGLDETIDQAAHQAATSPLNERPEPTDAQKAAGNYAKGHVRISGMDVSIENPKGSIRRSKADAAEPWQVTMPGHYGYIRGTTGADGDHVDLFIGDKGDNGSFWVINQTTPDGKAFDEHKVVTGVDTAAEAIDLYKRSFTGDFGNKVLGSVSQRLDAEQLKALLPDMSKANALHTPKATNDLQQPDVAVPAGQTAASSPAGGDQPGGSGGNLGPVADAPVVGPAAAPAASGEPAGPADVPAPAPDQALRIIGRIGKTPKTAVPIELRANADGTFTPYDGKYPVVDAESGEPLVLPAGVTDAQAAEAIRASRAYSDKSRFYGVKEDPPSTAAPASDIARGDGVDGGRDAAAPGAATNKLAANAEEAEQIISGLKALLKCMLS